MTGDLGTVGYDLMRDLVGREGYSLGENYNDCGRMIFDLENQDVHAGGSGCGCAAKRTGRAYPAAAAKGDFEKRTVRGDRRVDEHDQFPAGREHSRHLPSLVHLTADA